LGGGVLVAGADDAAQAEAAEHAATAMAPASGAPAPGQGGVRLESGAVLGLDGRWMSSTGVPLPSPDWLPPDSRPTQFDRPLSEHGPWSAPDAVASDYFNYGLDAAAWTRYAARQATIRRELQSVRDWLVLVRGDACALALRGERGHGATG
jgi:hypothetical protein